MCYNDLTSGIRGNHGWLVYTYSCTYSNRGNNNNYTYAAMHVKDLLTGHYVVGDGIEHVSPDNIIFRTRPSPPQIICIIVRITINYNTFHDDRHRRRLIFVRDRSSDMVIVIRRFEQCYNAIKYVLSYNAKIKKKTTLIMHIIYNAYLLSIENERKKKSDFYSGTTSGRVINPFFFPPLPLANSQYHPSPKFFLTLYVEYRNIF